MDLAVLNSLADLSEKRSVPVLIDDAPWVDQSFLDAIALVVRRLNVQPVTFMTISGTEEPTLRLGRGVPETLLALFTEHAAGDLIDVRHPGNAPVRRARILEEAGGNPLALLELAEVVGASEASASSL